MSDFRGEINRVTVGGPYTYVLFKNGKGEKSADTQQTVGDALDAVKADISGLLAGETITKIVITVAATLTP